jgi:hypothetical protein
MIIKESYDSDYTYEDRYEYIKSKSVLDSDGFTTDYTMYYDNDEDKYIFIFGDADIYDPYNSEPDWECETEREANEWFNSYNGFEYNIDDDMTYLSIEELADWSTYDFIENFKLYTDKDVDKILDDLATEYGYISVDEMLEDNVAAIEDTLIQADEEAYEEMINDLKDNLQLNESKLLINEKISDNDYSESKKGTAYKVFRIKNGKLYPPMVANPGGEDTPIGVWLDAEEGEFAGLSKTGRKQVKSTGSGNLAYRPGWHLGDVPRAKQFDRSFSWQEVNNVDENNITKTVNSYSTFVNSYAKSSNVGNVYYVKDIDKYIQVVDNNAPYFPYDFVWAECEYVMDIDYQSEADEMGYMRTKADGSTYRSDKYQHSLAGLPKLPKNGYYKYRTNPNPDTVPWVITGAIKVTKLLDDYDVAQILGGNAPERQGGNKTLAELGLTQV